jgi:hypothetical protein
MVCCCKYGFLEEKKNGLFVCLIAFQQDGDKQALIATSLIAEVTTRGWEIHSPLD